MLLAMKSKRLKLIGLLLILAGLVGVGITAADMSAIYSAETGDSAPALAEAISGTMVPATVGVLLALVGVVLVLCGWWRGRRAKHSTGLQGA